MAYIPTEWFTGDTITAEKLNHIEEGIEEINETVDVWDQLNSMGKEVVEDLEGAHGPVVFYDTHGNEPHWTSMEDVLGAGRAGSGQYYLGKDVRNNFTFYSLDDIFSTSISGDLQTEFSNYIVAYDQSENRVHYLTMEELAALIAEAAVSPSPSEE